MQEIHASQVRPPFYRDERVLGIFSQLLVVIIVVGLGLFFYSNMITGLREKHNVAISFSFLGQAAGFDIGESLIEYSRERTYLRAFVVGLLNTFQVAFLGIIFATALGIVIGVMRLSTNFLVSRIASIYIDIFRNIPLLVLLIFWAQAVFLKLPRVAEAIILPGPIFLSNRGVAIPWGIPTDSWGTFLLVLGAGIVLGAVVSYLLREQGKRTGRMPLITLWFLLTVAAVGLVGWIVLPQPVTLDQPFLEGFNTKGGKILSQQFMALLSGLIIYTAAFIAEVVRAGIQSVSKGQREAATSLGLNPAQTLRLIIFPQALRVIIPPLTSQYLNLTKNSSLAIAIGYPDLFAVAGNTILNQTGREIEMFTMIMGTYLSLSLLTSLLMNIYNRRIRLVER
ncbi:MAG: ABC transporter permease subunit [Caldilineaceae bacterium SB0661_bin_32]|uniref:ABC transporter permease subunit n=1 Tax=Caldilineaceae bacterium SB0661_bin_32 TaxID=2605255 RepID=A0A6B1D719_9CHLR|nr:ABC transporter permease subunit [Caldilineaceae bacterium SB0661_bin_32]